MNDIIAGCTILDNETWYEVYIGDRVLFSVDKEHKFTEQQLEIVIKIAKDVYNDGFNCGEKAKAFQMKQVLGIV